jgi:hypothetical protein
MYNIQCPMTNVELTTEDSVQELQIVDFATDGENFASLN